MSRTTSSTPSATTVLGAVVALVLLAAAAFAVFGGGDDPASDFDLDAIRAPVIEGAAATQGGPAPTVEGAALLAEGTATVPVAGEPTMIVFLAHWCPSCNEEVPVVVDWLAADGLPEGVALRAVATGIDEAASHYPPDQWLRERDWTVPTLVDTDNSIAESYGVQGYPTWVFVDGDGTVLGQGGMLTAEQLDEVAAALVAG